MTTADHRLSLPPFCSATRRCCIMPREWVMPDTILWCNLLKAGDLPCQHPIMPLAPPPHLPQGTNRQMARASTSALLRELWEGPGRRTGNFFFFSCSSVQTKRNSASCRDPLIHKGTRMPQLSYRAKPTRCNQLGLARRPPLCTHLGFTPTSLADMAEHRLDLPALMCTGMGTWQWYSKYVRTYTFSCWKNASHSSKETSKSCCTLLSLHCRVGTGTHQQKQQLPVWACRDNSSLAAGLNISVILFQCCHSLLGTHQLTIHL